VAPCFGSSRKTHSLNTSYPARKWFPSDGEAIASDRHYSETKLGIPPSISLQCAAGPGDS
jgi:hypothetical protein